MKNALSLKLGQNLSMTPALQQAIRLLQMASIDLRTEIQDALDGNLMLEQDDGDAGETPPAPTSEEIYPEAPASAEDGTGFSNVIPEELDEDFSWNDIYSGNGQSTEAMQALHEYRQASLSAAPDLRDHVMEQLRLEGLSAAEQNAAAYLVDALDERGYIPGYPELEAVIREETGLDRSGVTRVLTALQSCDPAGVGARDLQECMLLQLAQGPVSDSKSLARKLVETSLAAIATTPSRELAKTHHTTAEDIDAALALIRQLQPHPGTAFFDHESQYVSPDLFVRKRGDNWEAYLNPEIAPRIRINSAYQSFVKRGDTSNEQQTLKQHLTEARHFLHALRSRNDTLLRVGQEIVDLQRGFLEYGPEAMKPLVLRDVAERVGLHESTVSRATANKYMHTPRGLFELKYFFSSSVSQAEGGTCSATAIQAMIKRFVSGESPNKPLSDAKLAQMLQDEGVNVARRTIAKYRETLGIPPTHERRVRR